MSSISKNLGSVVKWSGRYSFLFLIIGLILFATTITLADPSLTEFNLEEDETIEYNFTLETREEVQILIAAPQGDDFDIVIFKLNYINGNQTYDFRQSADDEISFVEVASSAGEDFYRVLDLAQGDYQIQITNLESSRANLIIGFAFFNLGLIIATVITWIIFGVIVSVFFIVLSLWVISLVVSSPDQSERDKEPKVRQQSNQYKSSEPISSGSKEHSSSFPTKTPSIIAGTKLEKLTRKDWAWLIVGVFFFLGYLTNPLNAGPALFIAAVIFLGVTYNFTEREKNKNRILILLKAYPKSSIAFISEQLDKKEDYVIEVLRIMILDEGQPIRLDLVNRTVTKVGPFSDEEKPTTTVAAPNTTNPVSAEILVEDHPVTDKTSDKESVSDMSEIDDSQIQHGDRGTVKEPWAYCQQCGEGLKSKVKYCYVCGARQYK